MSEQQCPVCKRDSYLNPNIKILISPCFHKLCEQCTHEIFSHGYAPCPQCKTPLRKINFMTSTFEDANVECEIRVRRMLGRHFTRNEDNFENLESYDEYLEAFENLVFEMIEIKNELMIKERINEIKSSENILNPVVIKKSKINNETDDADKKNKERKLVETWCLIKEKFVEIKLTKKFEIPEEMFKICEGSGLTKQKIAGIYINGLIY